MDGAVIPFVGKSISQWVLQSIWHSYPTYKSKQETGNKGSGWHFRERQMLDSVNIKKHRTFKGNSCIALPCAVTQPSA